MNKSTKTVVVIIGILSILAGIYGFFTDSEPAVTYRRNFYRNSSFR